MLRSLLSIMLPCVLVACGLGSEPAESVTAPVCASGQIDGEVVVATFNDRIHPEVIDEFERRYGEDVEEVQYWTEPELLERIIAGADQVDVVLLPERLAGVLWRGNRIFPLDPIALPGRINLDEQVTHPPAPSGEIYSIPIFWGTVGIGFNTNVVPDDHPPSWGLIFDSSQAWLYAGRVTALVEIRHVMAAALLHLGHSPNSADPEEVAAAARLIRDARAHIDEFDSDRYAQRLADGDLDVAQGRSDAFRKALPARSTDLRYVIPQEGSMIWVESLVIPVSSPHPCSAHTFIDFLLEPRNAARMAAHAHKATSNTAAASYLSIEELLDPLTYPTPVTRERLTILHFTEELDRLHIEEFALAVD